MSTGSASPTKSRDEEKASLLLDEKTLSDIEADARRAEIDSRFSSPGDSRPRSWLLAAGVCAGNNLLRAPPWRTAAVRTFFFLTPSFLQHRLPTRDSRRLLARGPDRLSPTAYLDGMRGVAAFGVFLCHYFYTCFRSGWGWGFDGGDYYFLKLPYIRLWYQGPTMVCIFFVISGYALSLKPLKLVRAAAAASAARRSSPASTSPSSSASEVAFSATMSSFVFRRFFRLYLPTAASTFLILVLLRLGAYEWEREFARDARYMRNVQETHPERLGTLAAQLSDWCVAMFKFVHVWDWAPFGGSTAYDVHLWTIPVEFRCSMVLFTTLVGTARLRSWIRMGVLALLAGFCYRSDKWEMLLFYCGAVLAELDLIRNAHTDPRTSAAAAASSTAGVGGATGDMLLPTTMLGSAASSPTGPGLLRPATTGGEAPTPIDGSGRRARNIFWWTTSIVALYLMCQPDLGSEVTPGWVFLSTLIPAYWTDKYRYWQSIGSVIFVASVARLPPWQRVFNSGLTQYLGRISYAIYLMHGPVMHTVGFAIERRAWYLVVGQGGASSEDTGEAAFVASFALASLFVVPCVVWAADVFWRAVDAPVVRFAKWFEAKCSALD